MGYNCRCKKCGTDFVDMYGEFVNKNDELECPICGNTDLWLYNEIPDYEKTFNPIYVTDDIKKVKDDYE